MKCGEVGVGWGGVVGMSFLFLRETHIQNLNAILSQEPLKKVPGGGC